jgi:hypothetical protein
MLFQPEHLGSNSPTTQAIYSRSGSSFIIRTIQRPDTNQPVQVLLPKPQGLSGDESKSHV